MGSPTGSSSVIDCVVRQLKILAVSFLVILFVPLNVVAALFFGAYRAVVSLLARVFHPELTILCGGDAVFATEPVYTDAGTTAVVHLICKGSMVTADTLRVIIEKNILSYQDERGVFPYRRLRQRCSTYMGYYCWEDEGESFSIDHHIRLYDLGNKSEPELALPSPCTHADLMRVTNHLLVKPHKDGKSPWELLLIPNYQQMDDKGKVAEEEHFVVCLRFHHSLGDGQSLLGLLYRMFDTPMMPPGSDIRIPPKISVLRMALANLWVMLLLPYDLATLLVDMRESEPNSWTHPRKSTRATLTFCSELIRWEDMRILMRKYRVNSNAVLYSVTAGAAFRLMKEAGQVVPNGTVCAIAPSPLPNHSNELINHVSATYFTVKPGVHSGTKLIRQVGKQIRHAHFLNRRAVIASWILKMCSLLPAWALQALRVMNRRAAACFTFVFSNIPGPQRELETEGIRVVEMIGSSGVAVDGGTASIALMVSCLGKVRIVFSVMEGAFEGYDIPKNFPRHVEDEIRMLLSLDDDKETFCSDIPLPC